MNTMHAVVSAVVVFLACTCSVSGAECGFEVLGDVLKCGLLYADAMKDGTEPTCSALKEVEKCFADVKAMCEGGGWDETQYNEMKDKIEKCAAPRPSIGLVLIVVSVMSMLLAVNRY